MPPKKHKRDRFQGLAPLAEIPKRDSKLYDCKGIVKPKPLKKRSTTTIPREKFLDAVCDELAKYLYLGVKQRLDLMVACRYTFSPLVPLILHAEASCKYNRHMCEHLREALRPHCFIRRSKALKKLVMSFLL